MNFVYYYKHDYLQACDEDDCICGRIRRLAKGYVRVILKELCLYAHHVYVMLETLPINRFSITRYYDYHYIVGVSKTRHGDEAYTVDEFLSKFDLFHPNDRFRILFYDEVLYYERGVTTCSIRRLYLHYMQHLCESSLRSNSSARLTRELTKAYGLTKKDVKIVRNIIKHNNVAAKDKIQSEYDALKWLDCIRK